MAPSKYHLQRDVDQFRVFLYLLDAGEDVESLAAPFVELGWIVEVTCPRQVCQFLVSKAQVWRLLDLRLLLRIAGEPAVRSGELCGRYAADGAVRPHLVVVTPPARDTVWPGAASPTTARSGTRRGTCR